MHNIPRHDYRLDSSGPLENGYFRKKKYTCMSFILPNIQKHKYFENKISNIEGKNDSFSGFTAVNNIAATLRWGVHSTSLFR